MIFGGRSLNSFGPAKVTSWRKSLANDINRQQLSFRGGIIASNELPAVRQIQADILVRGADHDTLMLRLNGIAEWLYGAGVAKLFARQDTSHYYMARCTQITKPVYSGPSARITATFDCVDYRLYTTQTDEAVSGTLESNLDNFTFAGVHCLSGMGCVFIRTKIDALPSARLNKYAIAGVSGTTRYDDRFVVYNEKSLTGNLYFVKGTNHDQIMSQTEIETRMHEVASWLGNAGRAALVFDSDPTRQYMAELEAAQPLSSGETSQWYNGCISIQMVLQPYSEDVASASQTRTFDLTANSTFKGYDFSQAVPNGLGYDTPVIVEISRNSGDAITDLSVETINNDGTGRIIRLKGNNFIIPTYYMFPIVINGVTSDITRGSTSFMEYLYSGDFPAFSTDPLQGKLMLFKCDADCNITVKVTAKARWL